MTSIIQKEKKVEYLELIYDLIFVYIVGRNNSLLHHIRDGFVPANVFVAYIVCTLAVIQIWNYTTFYMNKYGRNSVRDHVFLFLNMFLLYYIADAISIGWERTFYQFNIAWALTLLNIAIQHILETRNHREEPWETFQLKLKAGIIFAEVGLIGVHILVFSLAGVSIAYVPIIFGIVATIISGKINSYVPVDFTHLTERAMLYVVFTFGEMIISIAPYFADEFTVNNTYFSVMAFLIVVGLFLSYGTLYNRIIDRETITSGSGYMMIHIFLIFALNNISVALEFMRDEKVDLLQKTIMLVGSYVLYFAFMFMTERYAKRGFSLKRKNIIGLCVLTVVFVALMIMLREVMYINIAITVAYVYVIFVMIRRQAVG